jgi:hypothetical protein
MSGDRAVLAICAEIRGDKVLISAKPSEAIWPGKCGGLEKHQGKTYRLASVVVDAPLILDRITKGRVPEFITSPPNLDKDWSGSNQFDATPLALSLTAMIFELARNHGAKFESCYSCTGKGLVVHTPGAGQWTRLEEFLVDWLRTQLYGGVSPMVCRSCGGTGNRLVLPEENPPT